MGEIACLFAVVSEGQDLTLADVTDYLQSDGIAKYKWPERLETISAMPLTPTGKVMRGELKARLTS
jgi:non-ribosomal peptide synthetase component E (peptide arylation enzyme)